MPAFAPHSRPALSTSPRTPRLRHALIAAVGCVFALASTAAADKPSRWNGGIDLAIASARGAAGKDFGIGVGAEAFGVWRLDSAGVFGVRVDGGMIDFGTESHGVQLTGPGPIFGVVLTTRRMAVGVGVGPQLSWSLDRFRPYAYATVRAIYLNSKVDLSGRDSLGRWIVLEATEDHFGIGGAAGGGLSFRITSTVSMNAGAEYRHFSDARTLGSEAMSLSNGNVLIPLRKGDADFIVFRIGVTMSGPPGGRRGPPPPRGG